MLDIWIALFITTVFAAGVLAGTLLRAAKQRTEKYKERKMKREVK